MELVKIAHILRRWLWLIISISLVTGVVLVLRLQMAPPKFEARVKLQLTAPQSEDVAAYDQYRSISLRDQITIASNNFVQALKSNTVREQTIDSLSLDAGDGEYEIDVNTIRDADYIIVTFTAGAPDLAASIANAHVQHAITYYGQQRALPTLAEKELFGQQLQVAQQEFETKEDLLSNFQAEHGINSLESELATYQKQLEQLQLERDRVLLEEATSARNPITEVDALIAAHESKLDELAALVPTYNVLQENVLQARERYQQLSAQADTEGAQESAARVQTAEDALAAFRAEHGIVNLDDEMATYQRLLEQLRLERDQRLLDKSARGPDPVGDVEALIAQRQEDMDRLQALVATHSVLTEDVEQARAAYQHLLDKYTEAEIKAIAVSAANFIQSVEPAQIPTEPIRSSKKLLLLALAGSLGFGVLLAFLLDYLSGESDVKVQIDQGSDQTVLGIPILGRVPRLSQVSPEPSQVATESIRQLRTQILLSSPPTEIKTLIITSPQPRDGKTLVAAYLGQAMAQAGAKTILVDADLRVPALHEWFDLPNPEGLSDLLTAKDTSTRQYLPSLLRKTRVPGLQLLSAGSPVSDPSFLLLSPQFKTLLDLLSEQYDLILLDGPPVLPVPDATILSRRVQSTMLVLSLDRTSHRSASEAVHTLRARADAHILGAILNRTRGVQAYAYHRYKSTTQPTTGHKRFRPSLSLFGRSPDPSLVSLSQAASRLGVQDATVKRWCQQGRLTCRRVGLAWWVQRAALEREALEQMLATTGDSARRCADSRAEDVHRAQPHNSSPASTTGTVVTTRFHPAADAEGIDNPATTITTGLS